MELERSDANGTIENKRKRNISISQFFFIAKSFLYGSTRSKMGFISPAGDIQYGMSLTIPAFQRPLFLLP